MSTVPGFPMNTMKMAKPPAAKYKCPVCEAEDFPIMLLNTITPLSYAVGNEVGQLTALRTIAGCGNCRSVLSIQFIPVDIQTPVGKSRIIA